MNIIKIINVSNKTKKIGNKKTRHLKVVAQKKCSKSLRL